MQFGLQHMMQTQGPESMMSPTVSKVPTLQQAGAGGGAMDGIMNSIQTGFDQLDSAMQGAFNTIQDSLSNNYSSQEVIVPTNPGGDQPPQFDVMPRLPMPPDFGGGIQPLPQPGPDFPGADFGNLMPYQGMFSNNAFGTMDPTPPGGIGNATMDPGGTGQAYLNQDNNQQQSIDEMFANLAGQFNG